MLGSELSKLFPDCDKLHGKNSMDLCDPNVVREYFEQKQYDIIIHLAAITNRRKCQLNPEGSKFIHSEIVDVFNKCSDKLIYVSTVPIWNDREISEEKDLYFCTKKEGENRTLQKSENVVIRTNLVGNGGLLKWAIESVQSGKSIDGYTNSNFNPAHTQQVSSFIFDSCGAGYSGLYNVFGDTVMSKHDFLKKAIKKKSLNLSLLRPKELKTTENLVYDKKGKNNKFFSFEECLKLI